MGIAAYYFDGKTSRRFHVHLSLRSGMASIAGDISRTCPVADLHVSERLGVTRKLTYADGAFLEVEEGPMLDQFLVAVGYRDPIAIRVHRSWRWGMAALGIFMAIMALTYLFALPTASKYIAKVVPDKVQRSLGKEALAILDKHMLTPSALSMERQQAIVARFQALVPPRKGKPVTEILFRKSRVGPNAFALPSGQIVVTDELVMLLDNDDAVLGVLAHELGHVHERHLMRRIVQSSIVGLASAVMFGDVSTLMSAASGFVLDMKYSRDVEREADDYAIAMMKANSIPLSNLAGVFEKLGQKSPEISTYLSSHPSSEERIQRIRAAE